MREFGIGDLVERRLPGAARVVDDNVDAAEALDRFLDEALHVAGLRRVRDHRQHLDAQLAAFGGLLLHHIGAPRTDRDRAAEFSDPRRRRPPYALAAAGNCNHLAFETQLHVSSLF